MAAAIEPVGTSPIAIGDRRSSQTRAEESYVPPQRAQDAEPVVPHRNVPETRSIGTESPGGVAPQLDPPTGGALFDAATIVEQLPPPPPLPRPDAELAWVSTLTWTPPESELRLKDVTV